MKPISIVTALACVLASVGCAALNEGQTDIRRAGVDPPGGWFVSSGAGDLSAIRPEEPILITIDQIFIEEFEETHFEPSRLPGKGLFQARGEVAVLVGVPTASRPASYVTPDGHYLVFYSNDVVEKQFLNVRNQRVYGPSAVLSDRMEVEFLVLELDRTSIQERALLTGLADLGKSYAGMGGPVGSVLTDLGASLLSAENDDVEVRHRFTFDLGDRPNARFPLFPGFYVAIREDRSSAGQFDWTTVCLNRETGQLHWLPDPNHSPAVGSGGEAPTRAAGSASQGQLCYPTGSSRELFKDSSYVVFHVERGVEPSSQAMTTFAAFGAELAAVPGSSAMAVGAAIDRARAAYVTGLRRDAIWAALGRLEDAAAAYRTTRIEGRGDAMQQAARSALLRASAALYRDLSGVAETVGLTPPHEDAYDQSLYSDQIERLTDFFGRLFWAPLEKEAEWLASSHTGSAFKTVFGTPGEFSQRVLKNVEDNAVIPEGTSPPT
ncbi:MAG: hypothetical protein DCF28_07505 [Alphaproteobacteria bacterium]|nr:MAG: hypothetical protein DCF28_07505 [Alphaproteobacteria bacterium]PZO36341.1 MAG: hypothetical protein DCE92_09005 [Alphaproteobacteria bacterium]